MDETPLTAVQKKLVDKHVNLAHAAAKAWWDANSKNQWGNKNSDDADLREATAIAYQGLCSAAQKWNPNYHEVVDENYDINLAFLGFAKIRIRGAILDWQRTRDHVPRRQRSSYKDLQTKGHGIGRSPEQLAEITGMSADKIRQLIVAVESTSVSLDSLGPEDGSTDFGFKIQATQDVESSAVMSNTMRAVADTLEKLPPVQQRVIVLHYYLGHDLPVIAAEMGIRLAQVREAKEAAIILIHDVMMREAS